MVWYGDIERIEAQLNQLGARIVKLEEGLALILYHAKRITTPAARKKVSRRKKP